MSEEGKKKKELLFYKLNRVLLFISRLRKKNYFKTFLLNKDSL